MTICHARPMRGLRAASPTGGDSMTVSMLSPSKGVRLNAGGDATRFLANALGKQRNG
jgi:hypothetical protein